MSYSFQVTVYGVIGGDFPVFTVSTVEAGSIGYPGLVRLLIFILPPQGMVLSSPPLQIFIGKLVAGSSQIATCKITPRQASDLTFHISPRFPHSFEPAFLTHDIPNDTH
jgi:hypothetical protein